MMLKYFGIIILVLLGLSERVCSQNCDLPEVWYQDFEGEFNVDDNLCDINWGFEVSDGDKDYYFATGSSRDVNGECLKLVVEEGDHNNMDNKKRERAEVRSPKWYVAGKTVFYRWSMYIPDDGSFPDISTDKWHMIAQWDPKGSKDDVTTCCYHPMTMVYYEYEPSATDKFRDLSLYYGTFLNEPNEASCRGDYSDNNCKNDNYLKCDGCNDKYRMDQVTFKDLLKKGTWNDFTFRITWSTDKDQAKLKMWVNKYPGKDAPDTVLTGYPNLFPGTDGDPIEAYFKMGHYRGYGKYITDRSHTAYYDEFVATTNRNELPNPCEWQNKYVGNGEDISGLNGHAQVLKTENQAVLASGQSSKFYAQEKVVLNPGFKTQSSSHFLAEIRDCRRMPHHSSSSSRIAASDNNRQNVPADEGNASFINLYPNPTSGTLNIDLSGKEVEKAKVKVFNSLGKAVFTKRAGKEVFSMNLSDLPDGVYQVKILTSQDSFVKQVVKQ